ncbi:MFS transporter [Clostridium sp. MCC353]|uniref:MFS transporter n=1 Tax=Clostridium sp. MCC353 TaxID=2592646 RepID=UPI001C012058|nr:MFS transporter [Clostridium sp. MCC353]MBT9775122.1 MFS transporter [Clostridium sp. MCC353]
MKNNTDKSFGTFMLLWAGDFISAIGSGLTSFGLGVYIFQQTGRVSLTALVTLLAFLPSLLLGPIAGVLADRYDRRLLMVLGDGLSAVGLLFILVSLMHGEARLWQICAGVAISSVFASLLEPAYKATITDLLKPEQYSKASGLVQIAGSAKYLISPILAGYLLTISDIRLLLFLDICTFFVTAASTLVVKKGLQSKEMEKDLSFSAGLKDGFEALAGKKGLLTLALMGALITFCLGIIQTLASPMVLSFSDSATLGTLMTVITMGMLVSSAVLGGITIKKGYAGILSLSLFGAGIFMVLFGLRENVVFIGAAGFLFFAMLPFANASLDYLIRTNIENRLQGRAWGLIGLISQLGYAAAYAVSGLLADYVFTPLLLDGGALSENAGKILGTGPGRGIGLFIILAGMMLCLTSGVLYSMKSIRNLEGGDVS